MTELEAEGFTLGGVRHPWKTGRMPETTQDWITEYRLLLQDNKSKLLLWGDKNDEAERLAQQIEVLTQEKQQLVAEQRQPAFHLGKRPETPDEIDAEVRLRETERRWEVELADRKHQTELAYEQSGLVRRAEGVRSWALVAVVFAIIASPWVAMIAGVAAKDFSLYIAPVTGIAGAIIGYWFGQGKQIEPPPIALHTAHASRKEPR